MYDKIKSNSNYYMCENLGWGNSIHFVKYFTGFPIFNFFYILCHNHIKWDILDLSKRTTKRKMHNTNYVRTTKNQIQIQDGQQFNKHMYTIYGHTKVDEKKEKF